MIEYRPGFKLVAQLPEGERFVGLAVFKDELYAASDRRMFVVKDGAIVRELQIEVCADD